MTAMTTLIGRLGMDPVFTTVATAKHSDGAITITGVHRSADLEEHTVARTQLQGLARNVDEPIVPVLITGMPAGFWRIDRVDWDDQAGALDDGVLHAEWSVTLAPVDQNAAGILEARLVMLPDTGPTPPDASPWTAIPDQAAGWAVTSGGPTPSVTSRPAKSGTLDVFEGTALEDGRAQWRCAPVDYYQGAATILSGRSGLAADRPSNSAATFTGPGTHSWTVPPGVTRVRLTAVGAPGGTGGSGIPGGRGALVSGTVTVTPGDVLSIRVGGAGGNGRGVGRSTVAPSAKNVPGGVGGWNGGANGGYGSSMHKNTFALAGAGGGGATDIRLNGVTATDRILVAAGGGGGANAQGGAAAAVNGGSGAPSGAGGQGGSTTAAGVGGWYGTAVGHDAVDHTGGTGGGTVATGGVDFSGGGGGGGGYYGGGGGASQTQGGTAGGGGAGSSLVPSGGSVRIAPTGLAPQVQITPVTDSGVGDPPDGVQYRTVVGRQIEMDPWGWQVTNSVIRIRPTWSETEIGWVASVWTGAEWTDEYRFGVAKVDSDGNVGSATSVPTTVTVLRNAPETVTLRLGYADASKVDSHTIDLTLRRGARHVDMTLQSTHATQQWRLIRDPAVVASGTAGNVGTNGHYLYQTAAGPAGERWMMTRYRAGSSAVHTDGGVDLGVGAGTHFGFGFIRSGESHAAWARQFNARGSESVRYITT